LFRRGKCRSELGDIDGAKEDLEKAAAANPEDGMVKRELRLLQQKFKEHEKKVREGNGPSPPCQIPAFCCGLLSFPASVPPLSECRTWWLPSPALQARGGAPKTKPSAARIAHAAGGARNEC
jgi:hypothetical protein